MSSSSSTKHLLSGIEETLGPELFQKITNNSKLLVVGAGGIGCELLKNLALSGFRNLEIIDLDTIDVSNLNRQLLFRSQHVGMPKCTVAAQVAAEMVATAAKATAAVIKDDQVVVTAAAAAATTVQYKAHHGNVCDNALFNVPFVRQFDLVLNALDNVVARRRVNRLCLAADVPLIEAGTTGYLGQCTVIHKPSGVACYECTTQEQQKVYPICTIRSTPSMPVHTIVWSKELYKLLFHDKVEESMLYEDQAGTEPSTYMPAVLEFRALLEKVKTNAALTTTTTTNGSGVTSAPQENQEAMIRQHAGNILSKLYVEEIQKQLDMDRYKTARKTPVVLNQDIIQNGVAMTTAPTKSASSSSSFDQQQQTNNLWSPTECVAEFVACLQDALQDPVTVLPSFDKDDDMAMRFVTATSNLRSFVFGIEPLQSYYSAKGIAGNIIPAIATTNAICAGLQILQAFHVLRAQIENKPDSLRDCCRYINCIRNKTRNGLYLTAGPLSEPNPACFVCRDASVPVSLNLSKWTLADFLKRLVKQDLGFEEPTIQLDSGDCIWEEGEDADQAAFEQNLPKLLRELPCGGIQHGSVVTIEDFSQDLTVNVTVTHQEVWETSEEEGEPDDFKFVIGGTKPVPKKEASVASLTESAASSSKTPVVTDSGGSKTSNGDGDDYDENDDDDDDDDICVIVKGEDNGKKHAAEAPKDEPPAKKAKIAVDENVKNQEVEVIEID